MSHNETWNLPFIKTTKHKIAQTTSEDIRQTIKYEQFKQFVKTIILMKKNSQFQILLLEINF